MAHFLKRLELNGFKSFAGRTTLEFPAGITAIVGPNGSGKSNIVDAVRWLLGERDAKSLRGGRIDDLIFAGTPKRARVGQAQATLFFENHNHFFPVDFEEVSVSRIVNRDGESRYLLNKSDVLLRELVDFFAKVRLGSRGIVVVTQGNSDMFIQATPSARREMLEEVLGLKEYQIKRTDAQRRLKNAQDNLVKVQALIDEISPHLRSLQRQTKRWERRDVVLNELVNLENQFFGSQLQDIKRHQDDLNNKKALQLKTAEELQGILATAQKSLEKVEAQKPHDNEEGRQLKTQASGLLDQRSILQKEIGRLEAQWETATAIQKENHTESETPEESLPTARALADGLKQVKANLQTIKTEENIEKVKIAIAEVLVQIEKIFEIKKTVIQNQRQNQAFTLDATEIKIKLENAVRELAEVDNQLASIAHAQELLQKSSESYYDMFRNATAALTKAKDQHDANQTALQQTEFEIERYQMRCQELEKIIEQAGRTMKEFERVEITPIPEDEFRIIEQKIFRLRADLTTMGEVDEAVVKEARETAERYDFLTKEASDLVQAIQDLNALIKELVEKMKTEFTQALTHINREFNHFFELMFGGGSAHLVQSAPRNPKQNQTQEQLGEIEESSEGEVEETGIEVSLSLPRKRIASLDVLSGGERSLVGIAAIFALISVSPPPFLVLDEIDAPLDERNARRFAEMLKSFAHKTQFLVVTHNRVSMEVADVLYGVTLDADGTSKVVSLKFENM